MARRRFGERRIGHAGTLDPSATGVLVVGIGNATRLLRFATAGRKTYECDIVFGIVTNTLDAAGETVATHDMRLDPSGVAEAAAAFVGTISQLPPMVSAVRVGGRRLHEIARAGQTAAREPREVEVYRFDTRPTDDPLVYRTRVECGAGTYVRSLGADLGAALGGGAHVRSLRRTRSGAFTVAEAAPVAEAVLREPAELVRDLGQIRLSGDETARVRSGTRLRADRYEGSGPWALVDPDGILVGVHERSGDRLRATVLPT
ncbi:tRNA pseudouridine(55) synthase TruB [Candidatus Poriferisodalis sp.]|uniref:tRNA pseudouridine(55) synthase TruB n=1 Tax=Candidatus Poriferisodalis sp. TaxID=3101277 RepID=UPI003B010171